MERQSIKEFWDDRASLGTKAGTNDVIAKELEVRQIMKYVEDGMRVTDAGCGNGFTALEIAMNRELDYFLAFDFSEKMVQAAKQLKMSCLNKLKSNVNFKLRDITTIDLQVSKMDLIYTERTLINLPGWTTQKNTIRRILNCLNQGGLYVMCENFIEPVLHLNKVRTGLGLSEITPPWHNCYLEEEKVYGLFEHPAFSDVKLYDYSEFSSTYYFLSRVVNAHLSAVEGKDPEYDSEINRLALELPELQEFSQFSQVQIVVFEKWR